MVMCSIAVAITHTQRWQRSWEAVHGLALANYTDMLASRSIQRKPTPIIISVQNSLNGFLATGFDRVMVLDGHAFRLCKLRKLKGASMEMNFFFSLHWTITRRIQLYGPEILLCLWQ